MQSYSTEIYLPCRVPEISYVSKRKPFSDQEIGRSIMISPMSAIPFHKGALLLFGSYAFFIEDFEMLLEIDSNRFVLSEYLRKNPEHRRELEELNAIGAIAFGHKMNQIHYSREAYDFRKEYSGTEWINFSLAPVVLELDITNNCNSFCVHCSRDSRISGESLDLSEIKRIFGQCERYNIPELLVMGGEPLLHPRFMEILMEARGSGIKSIRTSTNGILMSSALARTLAEFATHVQVSIHGSSAGTHDHITRTPGSFVKACEAVRLVRSEGIDTAISFTVLEDNVHEVEHMAELALKLGANTLRFLALSNVGRGRKLGRWTNAQRDQIGITIKALYEKYLPKGLGISVGGFPALSPIANDATVYGCAAARTHFHVAYNNIANPCGSVEGYHVCDVGSRDLLQAWHDDKFKKVRSSSKCECSYRYICSGSCKADTDFAD